MTNENYVLIAELKQIVGMQSQYLNKYLQDDTIVEGLRVKLDLTDYHQTEIHEEDLGELAERINQNLKRRKR